MEELIKDTRESEEAGDLVQDVYMLLTEHHYPPFCMESQKWAIYNRHYKP